jgi:hypothetical protein
MCLRPFTLLLITPRVLTKLWDSAGIRIHFGLSRTVQYTQALQLRDEQSPES